MFPTPFGRRDGVRATQGGLMAETMNRKVPAHSGARGGAGTGSPADFQAVTERGNRLILLAD